MNYSKALAAGGASLFAAVAIGAAAYPAHAHPAQPLTIVGHSENYVERRVSYADLNLASEPGERTLNRRVGYAVGSLCDEAVSEERTGLLYRGCADGAWRGARPQISAAIQRAHDIAATGTSSIAALAITISVPE